MTLLAHLVPRIAAAGSEPAATLALAYILNSSADAATAIVRLLYQAGVEEFELGSIANEEALDGNIPDLTIRDASGNVRILVENKFWAGLGAPQPVAYLESIPAETSGALLFIVPETRLDVLWPELRDKCLSSGLDLGDDTKTSGMTWAPVGNQTLAITSWSAMLTQLEHAAADDTAALHDIAQLKGLAERMNVGAFLPLTASEVTDASIPRRLINYSEMIDEIANRLVADGVARRKGLKAASTYTTAGRYVRLLGRYIAWLGIDHTAWRDSGLTPFWVRMWPLTPWSGMPITPPQRMVHHFNDATVSENCLHIPIRLSVGVGRGEVIDDAVRQVDEIAQELQRLFPHPKG